MLKQTPDVIAHDKLVMTLAAVDRHAPDPRRFSRKSSEGSKLNVPMGTGPAVALYDSAAQMRIRYDPWLCRLSSIMTGVHVDGMMVLPGSFRVFVGECDRALTFNLREAKAPHPAVPLAERPPPVIEPDFVPVPVVHSPPESSVVYAEEVFSRFAAGVPAAAQIDVDDFITADDFYRAALFAATAAQVDDLDAGIFARIDIHDPLLGDRALKVLAERGVVLSSSKRATLVAKLKELKDAIAFGPKPKAPEPRGKSPSPSPPRPVTPPSLEDEPLLANVAVDARERKLHYRQLSPLRVVTDIAHEIKWTTPRNRDLAEELTILLVERINALGEGLSKEEAQLVERELNQEQQAAAAFSLKRAIKIYAELQ